MPIQSCKVVTQPINVVVYVKLVLLVHKVFKVVTDFASFKQNIVLMLSDVGRLKYTRSYNRIPLVVLDHLPECNVVYQSSTKDGGCTLHGRLIGLRQLDYCRVRVWYA